MQCTACGGENPSFASLCVKGGAPVSDATITSPSPPPPRPPPAGRTTPVGASDAPAERFPSGATLANRYRILDLLGRGGMGEIYKARDIVLDQTVALKFLPEELSRDAERHARFVNEIRMARQMTHPNVCRVYDLDFAGDLAFISMEYVTGEDLGSLLRRIGRLPQNKALVISRKLCSGLAAAHAKGVLHRHFKPANVMIDAAGNPVIMDFGIACFSDRILAAGIRSGTPPCMAPGRTAGREVTVQSDIYALGLVLHEIFSGRRPNVDGGASTKLSDTVTGIDPAIERAIDACLQQDPRRRPASALAVIALLRGGDPLRAALEAGDAPSPGLVAASRTAAGLTVRQVWICWAVLLVCLAASLFLLAQTWLPNRISLDFSQDVLARRARDVRERLGYAGKPVGQAWEFAGGGRELSGWMRTNKRSAERAPLPPLLFWRRSSKHGLFSRDLDTPILAPDAPPMTLPGTTRVLLSPASRVQQFIAVPPADEPKPPLPYATGWDEVFRLMGFDRSLFIRSQSKWAPNQPFDARFARTGPFSAKDPAPIGIDAATGRGRLVHLVWRGPWVRPPREQGFMPSLSQWVTIYMLAAAIPAVLTVSCWLAVLPLRRGRSDQTGPSRLFAFLFVSTLAEVILMQNWLIGIQAFNRWCAGIQLALFGAAAGTVGYLAMERYVRRIWPEALITWRKMLHGAWRDPLVGSHVLAAVAVGLALGLPSLIGALLARGSPASTPDVVVLRGGAGILAGGIRSFGEAVALGMLYFALIFILRSLLRRTWIVVLVAPLLAALLQVANRGVWHEAGMMYAAWAIGTWLVCRFGVLVGMAAFFVNGILTRCGFAAGASAWFAWHGWSGVALILAVAIWATRWALAGRPLPGSSVPTRA